MMKTLIPEEDSRKRRLIDQLGVQAKRILNGDITCEDIQMDVQSEERALEGTNALNDKRKCNFSPLGTEIPEKRYRKEELVDERKQEQCVTAVKRLRKNSNSQAAMHKKSNTNVNSDKGDMVGKDNKAKKNRTRD